MTSRGVRLASSTGTAAARASVSADSSRPALTETTGTADAAVSHLWNIHVAIPFDSHERTGNDQTHRTIGIRDLSDDADAPRDYLLNPLAK
jgi:hypothetical protein